MSGGDRVRKRSVTIAGHPSSVTLEDAFWDALKEIAAGRGLSVNQLVSEIDSHRLDAEGAVSLSSAIRVHVLAWARERSGI